MENQWKTTSSYPLLCKYALHTWTALNVWFQDIILLLLLKVILVIHCQVLVQGKSLLEDILNSYCKSGSNPGISGILQLISVEQTSWPMFFLALLWLKRFVWKEQQQQQKNKKPPPIRKPQEENGRSPWMLLHSFSWELFSFAPGKPLSMGKGRPLPFFFWCVCEQTRSPSLKLGKWISQKNSCLYAMNMFKSTMAFSSNCVLGASQKYTFPMAAPGDKEWIRAGFLHR